MRVGKAIYFQTSIYRFLELRSRLLSLELCLLLWWLRLRLRLLERDLWRWRFSRDLERVLLFRSREAERDRCLRRSRDLDLKQKGIKTLRSPSYSISVLWILHSMHKKICIENNPQCSDLLHCPMTGKQRGENNIRRATNFFFWLKQTVLQLIYDYTYGYSIAKSGSGKERYLFCFKILHLSGQVLELWCSDKDHLAEAV